MAADTGIEWTDATWNPIVGCSIISPGCTNCYAMSMAARIDKMTLSSHYKGLTEKVKGKSVWTGKVAEANPHIFNAPLRWRKPKRIFVNSMGDLFHEAIPDEWIDRVFAIMALTPRHSFQVLTKRSERMRAYMTTANRCHVIGDRMLEDADIQAGFKCVPWPFPNVWLGVSAEDQRRADERLPDLEATPAVVRFASFEPLLGEIKLWHVGDRATFSYPGLGWAIVGGESGPNARPMNPEWARSLRDQCASASVPFFFKQWGEWVSVSEIAGSGEHRHFPGGATVRHVGRKRAGRKLDGAEHSDFPGQS